LCRRSEPVDLNSSLNGDVRLAYPCCPGVRTTIAVGDTVQAANDFTGTIVELYEEEGAGGSCLSPVATFELGMWPWPCGTY
jgi:hypothetical protein